MTIKVGERIPDGALSEFIETATDTCAVGPNGFQVAEQAKGKKIAVFAVPGAFTPTCSENHLPGFLEMSERFKAKGIDEIWCVSVNDPFVMGAWGRERDVKGRIRMLADGSGAWTRALGVELDLRDKGLGMRSRRYSALLDDGVIKALNLEEGGKLERSDARTLLEQI